MSKDYPADDLRNVLDGWDGDIARLRTVMIATNVFYGNGRSVIRDLRAKVRDIRDRLALQGTPVPPFPREHPTDPEQELRTLKAWVINALAKADAQPDAPPDTAQTTAGDAMLSVVQLAKRHGIDAEALRKRLERFRHHNGKGWIENSDRQPREPRYLFSESAVMPVINDLKTSGERPAR